jgi:uncharacterized protein (TIGR03435 family)
MSLRNTITLLIASISLALSLPFARGQEQMPVLTNTDPKAVSSGLKVPDFDVATVKKNKSGSGMMSISMKPDGFACENIPLQTLIAQAYGIKQDLISGGPAWVTSEGFDINAKVAGPDVATYAKLTQAERQSMLQALLADRFHLKLHRETKILPIYELVIAKGGARLKPLPPIDPAAEEAKAPEDRRANGATTTGPGEYTGEGVVLASLANNLAYVVHRTVTDNTGLTGIYNINLKWTPEDEPPEAGTEAGPSIFTALQEQLGLKLQPSKGPVETLVIDQADPPSEN